MSRLRELRLHGFKSFADPTRFAFEPGVNAIIGPNGSGKSNMADAVRWVLGEQSNRSLRTRRADDVIFGGSEGRRPLGMAEATLILDNADGWLPIDFAEVSIGRRAYRSGESEYLINDARARLRDVVELLAAGRLGANELVVVGQGTVDAALSLRPDERRQLFEEAAGVKNLQVRRNEASGRLARARDNLARVTDLTGELRPQVRRLALQAEHQQQHATLVHRATGLVAESHRRRESGARAALGDARRASATAEATLEALRAQLAAGREAVGAAETRYWEAEAAARSLAEARQGTREAVIRAEGELERGSASVRELRERMQEDERDREAAAARLHTLAVEETVAEIEPATALSVQAELGWRDAVEALAEADAGLLAAEEAVADLRRRQTDRIAAAARRDEDAARGEAKRAAANHDRGEMLAALDAARVAFGTAKRDEESAEKLMARARTELEAAADLRDAAQLDAEQARGKAAAASERLAVLRAEQSALHEDADPAGRLGSLLISAGWPVLLDAFDVPDGAWPAIEALVGGELEHALLWRGPRALESLATARGSATLLEAETPSADGREAALAAVRGDRTLAEWVGSGRAPAIFHRAVIAPSVDALVAGWRRLPAGWTAVTAAGDLADARGLLVLRGRADGGESQAARTHARRRELQALLLAGEREQIALAHEAHRAAEELRAARDRHVAAHEAADRAEHDLRGAHVSAGAAGEEISRLEREIARVDLELAQLAAMGGAAGADETGMTIAARGSLTGVASLDALEDRAAKARTRRDAAAAARDAARTAWQEARSREEEAETRLAGARDDRATLAARIAQLGDEIPRTAERLDKAEEMARDAGERLGVAREADLAADARRAAAERARDAARTELIGLEREGGAAVAGLAELERRAQEAAIEATRRDEALTALGRERELALEGLPVSAEAVGSSPDGADELLALASDDLEAELRRVRRLLGQIGSVNPFAVEEHAELSGRLSALEGQDSDLRAAIDATEELIVNLDGQIAQQFDAAFRAIGERFDEYCRLLFAGGSASLQLGDEADAEAPGGIEIVVRPPGKRLQRLAMLSGGERALTGVALLFAMLTVNPVPFCILDEVDAALDEANIGRFADALRRLAETIDFVVITHNRATIEIADTIYGVTMTDAAVSRVLSLRLADLPVEVPA